MQFARSTAGTTHGTLIKGNEIVLCAEAWIVEVSVQPGRVEEEGMEHDNSGLALIEASDIAMDGVRSVPE